MRVKVKAYLVLLITLPGLKEPARSLDAVKQANGYEAGLEGAALRALQEPSFKLVHDVFGYLCGFFLGGGAELGTYQEVGGAVAGVLDDWFAI